MSDSNSQDNLLKNQAEMINLALESVNTEEQAKELMNGRLEDAFLIKAKVDVENRIGALLILISAYKHKILELYSLFGNSPILRKIRTFEDYQQLSMDFIQVKNGGGVDNSLSEIIGQGLYSDLMTPNILSFLPAWESKDIGGTTHFIEQSIMRHAKANQVKVVAEVEKMSSIKFRYKNPMHGIVSPITYIADESVPEKSDENLLPHERQIKDIVRSIGKEVLCETMLSPVNGVPLEDLVENQEILFRLPTSSPQDKVQAQAMGGIDTQGKPKPVVGKLISVIQGDGEYHILAKGPSNTVLHSIEDGPVKVATTQKRSSGFEATALESTTSSIAPLIIGVAAVVCILILILAFL